MTDRVFLIGLFIATGGLITLGFALTAVLQVRSLEKWPTAEATIVSANIVKTTSARYLYPARNQLSINQSNEVVDDVWALTVEYRYQTDRTEHRGSRATSAPVLENLRLHPTGPSAELLNLLARVPPGAVVPVHVNPADPDDSYLLAVPDPGIPPLLKTGAALVVAGLVILLWTKLKGN